MSGTPPAAGARAGISRSSLPIVIAVIGVALAAWIASAALMRGMADEPGADIGPIGWFLGLWVTMMAAMMLPSAWPMVLAQAQVAASKARRRSEILLSCAVFTAGYLLAWTAYGLLAYLAYRAIGALDIAPLAWDRHGAAIAGVAIALIGVYQLTPLKRVCLRHCRSPLAFILHGWRPGLGGALRSGIVNGAWCVGCCAGLMALLFILGAMSLMWMGIVTALVFVEKLVPLPAIRPSIAVLCILLGLAIGW